jgi:hypothetical protein
VSETHERWCLLTLRVTCQVRTWKITLVCYVLLWQAGMFVFKASIQFIFQNVVVFNLECFLYYHILLMYQMIHQWKSPLVVLELSSAVILFLANDLISIYNNFIHFSHLSQSCLNSTYWDRTFYFISWSCTIQLCCFSNWHGFVGVSLELSNSATLARLPACSLYTNTSTPIWLQGDSVSDNLFPSLA